jgi:hypothetical protein
MNSLDKIFKTLVMAFMLFILLTGYATGQNPIPSSWSAPDPTPLEREQAVQQNSSAKKMLCPAQLNYLKKPGSVKI